MVRHLRFSVSRLAAAGLLLAAAVLGCTRNEPPRNEPKRPIPVDTIMVEPATFLETVRGVGSVRAKASVEVRPEIAGVLKGIHFSEGQEVARGDLLFTLDDSKLTRELAERQAALKAAEARLQHARSVFDRTKQLFDRRVAAQADLDQALADLRSAEAEISRLQAAIQLIEERLADTRIVAPMDGVTSRRMVDVGDYVQEGELLVNLFQVTPVEIAVNIPGRFAGHVRQGQQADVRVHAFPDRPFDGEVTFVSPEVDERTRSFLVKITVSNPERLLKPGAFATAALTVDVRENRPAVPEEALVATSEGYFVFVINGHKARLRKVEVGLRRAGLAEIQSGITLGERIVQSGHMQLSDGDLVRFADKDSAARTVGAEGEGLRP